MLATTSILAMPSNERLADGTCARCSYMRQFKKPHTSCVGDDGKCLAAGVTIKMLKKAAEADGGPPQAEKEEKLLFGSPKKKIQTKTSTSYFLLPES